MRSNTRKRTANGSRMSCSEALSLLNHGSLSELMQRADDRRRELHGSKTYFVHSLNLNPTNVCGNRCGLCAFWRESGDDDAYFLTLSAAEKRLRDAVGSGLTDLHVVGGLAPGFDLVYHEELFRLAKAILPDICIQGLTAVEIHYLAEQAGISTVAALERLKGAGLDALPGGGAEIFNEGVRSQICENKISADEWLRIHREAHSLGLRTNATMLFGHIETAEDIVDHMDRLRHLQDETGGIEAFIPLPFHPYGTRLDVEHGPTGSEIVRTVAVARLFLDNIPHIRVLANYVDRKLLEVLTHSGVDDLGGTSVEERIASAAGAPPDHRFISIDDMFSFSASVGLQPLLVNSVYAVKRSGVESTERGRSCSSRNTGMLGVALQKAAEGQRLDAGEALDLHDGAPFQELGRLAHAARLRAVPGMDVTFVIDRNVSLTNVCTAGCRFCAFHVKPGASNAFALSIDDVVKTVRESIAAGATQVLVQGGLNPDLDLSFYEEMLTRVKQTGIDCVHSLSPAEIVYIAGREGVSITGALERLHAAGLDSLPGGGAEILVDEVRGRISPRKLSADGWLEVMKTAQQLGMRTTATMVYGLGETSAQRIEHFMRIRDLQDETGGFTAFIPWSFQPNHTGLSMAPCTGIDYLRVLALSRLVLDNISHIQAGWVTEGPDVAQIALCFGADDFGGVLMEEQVVRATGVGYAVTREDVVRFIRKAGFRPVQRTTQYKMIQAW